MSVLTTEPNHSCSSPRPRPLMMYTVLAGSAVSWLSVASTCGGGNRGGGESGREERKAGVKREWERGPGGREGVLCGATREWIG